MDLERREAYFFKITVNECTRDINEVLMFRKILVTVAKPLQCEFEKHEVLAYFWNVTPLQGKPITCELNKLKTSD